MKFADRFLLPLEWLSDIDISMADSVSRWAEKEVMARRLEHGEDEAGLLGPALKTLFVDLGLQSLIWPEDAGGCNLASRDAAMTMAVCCEQAARGDGSIAYLLANTFTVLASFGIEPHRNEPLLALLQPDFCDGQTPAAGSLILPDYGFDPAPAQIQGLSCRIKMASRKKDLVLSGEKVRTRCFHPVVRLYGIFCVDEKGCPQFLLCPAGSKGIAPPTPIRQTGLAFAASADLAFADVSVPKTHVVLSGLDGFHEILEWRLLGCASCCSGALLACWEILKDWGDNRVIKGKGQVFKENPLVAALLGKIGAKIQTTRILVYNLARMISRPDVYGKPGSAALTAAAEAVAVTACRAAADSLNHAMELMASAGYATEWNLERYWRDVKTIECHLGPATKSRTDMARHYFDLESL